MPFSTKVRQIIAEQEDPAVKWRLIKIAVVATELDPRDIRRIQLQGEHLAGYRQDGTKFQVALPSW